MIGGSRPLMVVAVVASNVSLSAEADTREDWDDRQRLLRPKGGRSTESHATASRRNPRQLQPVS
jgi:hypothetical protein